MDIGGTWVERCAGVEDLVERIYKRWVTKTVDLSGVGAERIVLVSVLVAVCICNRFCVRKHVLPL